MQGKREDDDPRLNEVPRDYRDPQDVEEAVDAIRVGSREAALELYRTCLDFAYMQGRLDKTKEIIVRGTLG
jgi:hypothetical protein